MSLSCFVAGTKSPHHASKEQALTPYGAPNGGTLEDDEDWLQVGEQVQRLYEAWPLSSVMWNDSGGLRMRRKKLYRRRTEMIRNVVPSLNAKRL